MKYIRLLLFFLFAFKISFAQTWQDTLSIIDKAFDQYQPQNPGVQLSVSRNGQVIFSKAWGLADVERNVSLTTNSILEAGSVSKQFTAAAILLLEQQGKLSLNDDVQKYIPQLPDYGTPVKLYHLLHHCSGLKDWGDIADLTGWPRGKKFYTNDDVLEIIARQKTLNFKPGAEYLYSNSNYNLLAIIVQRVSGLTLANFTKKYIFGPAGMTLTQWRDDPNRIVPNRAIAYSKSVTGYEINMPNEYVYGQGGLLTTTEDLLKWNDFYQSGKFGNPSLLLKQTQLLPLNNGSINSYAAGLVIGKVMGWNSISHNGATAGYRASLQIFPELNLSFAILSNTSQFSINEAANNLRKIFVPDKTEKVKKDSSIHLSPAYLNNITGMYLNERNYSTFQLTAKNDTLIMDDYLPLISVSENIFKSDNFLLNIKDDKGLYISFSPGDTIHFAKVKPVDFDNMNLNAYAGKYSSEETGSSLIMQPDSNKLMIHLNADEVYQLMPTYHDAFKINELDCDVQFVRDTENKISILKFYFWRTRDVEFKKLDQQPRNK